MKQMRHIRTGIHSVLMFHVGASDIKLAPTFFAKVRARSRRCSSFPNRTRCAGLRFGIAASLRFYCVHENMDFSRSLPARNPFAFCGLRAFYVILSSS